MRVAAGWAGALTALVAVTAGCTAAADPAPTGTPGEPLRDQVAEQVLQVSSPHQATGLTLLEGPVFTPDGSLVVVDATAPAGAGKVLQVDLSSRRVTPLLTQGNAVYTSAQISPADGRLYLTDFSSGGIDSTALDGSDVRTFFAGPVDGAVMQPDDVAFDPAGNLYVSDTTGWDEPGGEDRGRVVRIAADASAATVVAGGLPAPNGIAFTPDSTGLLLGQHTANRIDHLGLTADGTGVTTRNPAVHVSPGDAQVDSTAVDAAGNVYQGLYRQARILVFAPTGELLRTIQAPPPVDASGAEVAADMLGGDWSATNVAVRPGTTEAVMTVSGPAGGFVYSFTALAEGIRQTNGG